MGTSGVKWGKVDCLHHVSNHMFLGEHHHNLDEKGRVQIPVKWRSQLTPGAVLTKGFDGSLRLYPLTAWQAIAEKLASLPQSDPAARAYVRQTLAGAVDLELDGSGRVVLPAYLRSFAGLRKAVVLAGLHSHIELWDAQAWEQYVQGVDQNTAGFDDSLKPYGL